MPVPSLDDSGRLSSQKRKDALKGNDEHWVCRPSLPFRSIHHLIQSLSSQLTFSLLRHQSIRADFSGGQISSDAGLLPLRAFAQRHHLTGDWAVAVHVWLLPSIGGERLRTSSTRLDELSPLSDCNRATNGSR
jgi:hypothetical protein